MMCEAHGKVRLGIPGQDADPIAMLPKTFSIDDQRAFAALSGDWNPLHLDPVYARRTVIGRVVVHGIHAALWALDSWLPGTPEPFAINSFDAHFYRAIPVGAEVICSVVSSDRQQTVLELYCQDGVAARFDLIRTHKASKPARVIEDEAPDRDTPKDCSLDEVADGSGRLSLLLDLKAASRLFPNLMKHLPVHQIAAVLGSSRLVGMKCPGLHSLFSELHLQATDAHGSEALSYQVKRVDKRFRRIEIEITTLDLAGSVTTFLRKPPQQQAAFEQLKSLVVPREFAGQKALVVGGSRGLGEVVAKLLAAGGADVTTTYLQGRDDAARVTTEINAGGGHANHLQFDVLDREADALRLSDGWWPSHLYYFATPHISATSRQTFSPELFQKFCAYYVDGFCWIFQALRGKGLSHVFYPSTIFVEETPLDMAEYAAAKAAAETLCAWLEKNNPDVFVLRPRLPRMTTDQTVGLLPIRTLEPAPVLIELLRSAATQRPTLTEAMPDQ